ncbi:MAG: glycosyltransferase, partial [Bacteroidales bacterium]|nr:glycosyltransferase [Bacteroidales bacterium]
MQVSIIIVNFNTKNFLYNCLESIYKHTKDISFEIIVSDNGSTDGSIELVKSKFPAVILIANNKNLGFGAANNRGLEIAKGEFVFFLNSDTILLNNAVNIFYTYWQNYRNKNELGALGCNLIDRNKEVAGS